jgi:hypothetical protein
MYSNYNDQRLRMRGPEIKHMFGSMLGTTYNWLRKYYKIDFDIFGCS